MRIVKLLKIHIDKHLYIALNEELIPEGDNLYQLIVSRFGGSTRLSDGELFLGKKQLCTDWELYEQQRQKLIKRFELAIAGMEKNTAGIGLPALGLYREILADLERLG